MVPPIAVGSSPLQVNSIPMTRTGAIRAEDLEREFKDKKNEKSGKKVFRIENTRSSMRG